MSDVEIAAKIEITTKGILFDNDGVLISSILSGVRCWRQWAAHYGVPGAEHYTLPHGIPARDIMLSLKPEWRDAPDRVERMHEGLRYIEDLEIADVADLQVLAGVPELLGQLPPARWSIVTSATRRLLLGRLKAAQLPVPENVITADDVVRGKPDPEPYRKGAELLGFTPGECIVVEDAPSGVGAGVAAGCRVLGVLGTHSAEDLYKVGATWVVASLDLIELTVTPDELRLRFPAL